MLIKTVLLIPILPWFVTFMSLDICHKLSFYDILWHMSCDINVINHSNMGIKRTVLISIVDIFGAKQK